MDIEHVGTFPQCCGAIDGTHIHIIAPKEHHTDYYNRKCHHSVIMQGFVDYNYRKDVYLIEHLVFHNMGTISFSLQICYWPVLFESTWSLNV
jgi:hypothetical protein